MDGCLSDWRWGIQLIVPGLDLLYSNISVTSQVVLHILNVTFAVNAPSQRQAAEGESSKYWVSCREPFLHLSGGDRE